MTKSNQIEELGKLYQKQMDILTSKGADYATDDVLSNFKRISSAAKAINLDITSPHGYALFMVLMKIDRINNLTTSGKEPKNESVEDSFIDGINYFQLALLCYKEVTGNEENGIQK